ncbi:PAS domain-containing protein [Tranquillimonas alkanivorans]|uniref:PAS domain-containing protein n=1 Tax=Tranquillimonas alkanivorans TaxID=441119 RepID=A0A1I5P380_9RHOB|nr:PAS domain-containing protein [Tranquillimonas alkanivorans]SFP28423.1 PAS domain-containing protein [Tranquillimonas alkanivorans]
MGARREDTEAGNVISLAARRGGGGPPCFEVLERYWQDIARGRLVPDRRDVNPRRLEPALDHVFVVQRVAPGVARLRVAGVHLTDLMGMDMRGMPLSCLFHADARPLLAETLEAVFTEPARVELSLVALRPLLRARVTARMLLLPLRDDHGRVSRAIGCLDARGPARAPQRFSIDGHTHRTLIGYGQPPVRTAKGPDAQRPALSLVWSSDG